MQNETLEELIEGNHKRQRRIFIATAAILLIAAVSWLIAHLVRYYQTLPPWESVGKLFLQ